MKNSTLILLMAANLSNRNTSHGSKSILTTFAHTRERPMLFLK